MTNVLEELKRLITEAPDFPDELEPDGDGHFRCPCCDGDGSVDADWVTHAKSNAWPGGVQFYGVGHEHGHAEQLYLAARKHLPALLRIAEAAKAESQRHKEAADPQYPCPCSLCASLASLTANPRK